MSTCTMVYNRDCATPPCTANQWRYCVSAPSGSGAGAYTLTGSARTITQTTDSTSSAVTTYSFTGITGLTPGDSYKVDVRSSLNYNSQIEWTGWSSYALVAAASFTPMTPVPPAVHVLTSRTVRLRMPALPFDNGEAITKLIFNATSITGLNVVNEQNAYFPYGIPGNTIYDFPANSLTPGQNYSITVIARNSLGDSAVSSPLEGVYACAEEPAQMSAPTKKANAATQSSITMEWTPPPSDNGAVVTQYRLTLFSSDASRPCNGCTYTTCDAAPSCTVGCCSSTLPTELTVSGLTPGVTYEFEVEAYNGVRRGNDGDCSVEVDSSTDGWSQASARSATATTLATPPDQPSQVTLQTNGRQGKSLAVQWTAPYDNGDALLSYTLLTTASQCGSVTVACRNAGIALSNCAVQTSSSQPFIQDQCSNQQFISTDKAVTISSLDGNNGIPLVPNSTYYFNLIASNAAGDSLGSGNATFTTDNFVPDEILDSGFVTNGPNVPFQRTDFLMTIKWAKPADNGLPITKYRIKFRFDGSTPGAYTTNGRTPTEFTYPAEAYPSSLPASNPTSGYILDGDYCSPDPVTGECKTEYTFNQLFPRRGYQISVSSYNAYGVLYSPENAQDGWSDWSDYQTYFTSSAEALVWNTEESVIVSLVNATAATFNFTPPTVTELGQIPTPNRYTLQIVDLALSGSPTLVDITSGFAPGEEYSMRYSGLLPATTYAVSIAASNTEGQGSYSNATDFPTDASEPGAPTSLNVRNFTNTSLTLAWDPARPNGHPVDSWTLLLCWQSAPEQCQTQNYPQSSVIVNGLGLEELSISSADGNALGDLLLPGRSFTARVSASNTLGAGPFSDAVSAQTAAVPDAPLDVRVGSGVEGLSPTVSIQMVWDPPNAHGYALETYEVCTRRLSPSYLRPLLPPISAPTTLARHLSLS